MELSRERRERKSLKILGLWCGQGRNRTADTRIFSPYPYQRLCASISHHVKQFNRLSSPRSDSNPRSLPIASKSFGKVLAKRVREASTQFGPRYGESNGMRRGLSILRAPLSPRNHNRLFSALSVLCQTAEVSEHA